MAKRKKTKEPPWEGRPSLYEFLSETPSDQFAELPDAAPIEPGGMGFAPGALDGIMTHHGGRGEGDPARVKRLFRLIKSFCAKPSLRRHIAVYEEAASAPVLPILDDLLDLIREKAKTLDQRALRALGDRLTLDGADREVVKLGIGLLGLYADPITADDLVVLGRHDEFTLFAVTALGNLEDGERRIWWLARELRGWGRIQALERLAETKDWEIRSWLLREGFENDVMIEYTALPCARAGRLREALAADEIDEALFLAAGKILVALSSLELPVEGMESYEDGPEVVASYLRHAESMAHTLDHLVALQTLAARLVVMPEEAEGDELSRFENWSDSLRRNMASCFAPILDRPHWQPLVMGGLRSEKPEALGSIALAARGYDIDPWPILWERLRETPREPGLWDALLPDLNADRIETCIAYADEALPSEVLSLTPSEQIMAWGGEEKADLCHATLLEYLVDYPGAGARLVRDGLRSAYIQTRRTALEVLAAWGRDNWSPETLAALERAAVEEPMVEGRERMRRVLAGEGLEGAVEVN